MDLTDTVQGSGWELERLLPGRAGRRDRGRAACSASRRWWTTSRSSTTRTCSTQAGSTYPTADWTWDDFAAAAKALTDPATKQFGVAFPADASEDTVWHFDAMLWEGGGDILNSRQHAGGVQLATPGSRRSRRCSRWPSPTRACTSTCRTRRSTTLFNSGKRRHGRSPARGRCRAIRTSTTASRSCPCSPAGATRRSAAPTCGSCSTTATPRRSGASTFMQWFTAAEQVQADSMIDGHLPTRESVVHDTGVPRGVRQEVPRLRTCSPRT